MGTHGVAIGHAEQRPCCTGAATIDVVVRDHLVASTDPAGVDHAVVNPCGVEVGSRGRHRTGTEDGDGVGRRTDIGGVIDRTHIVVDVPLVDVHRHRVSIGPRDDMTAIEDRKLIVGGVGPENIVVVHVERVTHLPKDGDGAIQAGETPHLGGCLGWAGVPHTQELRIGVAHVLGSIDGGNGDHTRRNVGHVDADHRISGRNILIGEEFPLLRGVAVIEVEGNVADEVVLQAILVEIDGGIDLVVECLARTVDDDGGNLRPERRHQVG